MKYVRIQLNDKISYGIVEEEKVIEINGNPIFENCKETGETYNLSEVKILSPNPSPPKNLCLALNY